MIDRSEQMIETARQYNERHHPDLMARINRLVERTSVANSIPTGRSRAADVFANRLIKEVGYRPGTQTLVPIGDEWEEVAVAEDRFEQVLGMDADDDAFRRGVYGYRSKVTGAEVYCVVNHDSQLHLYADGHVLYCSDGRIRKGWWCYQ